MIGRAIAWILLVLALIAGGRDVFLYFENGTYKPVTLGELWFMLHPDSLQLIQPAIERHVAVWLWQDVMLPVIVSPAFLVLACAGLIVALLFGRRTGRRRRRSFG